MSQLVRSDHHIQLELTFGNDRLAAVGPQEFVENNARTFLAAVGRGAARVPALSPEAASLRDLYRRHGSNRQWENVLLFVYHFEVEQGRPAVSYDELREAFKTLGVKAPNVQTAVNFLKYNRKFLRMVRRGEVALTDAGRKTIETLTSTNSDG